MGTDADALVVGAGPAGTASAILLANAGWRVVLMEQDRYPRQKVCGECIAAANLLLLDELGVGPEFQRLAGPEIRRVGWMNATETVIAEMPGCTAGPYRYGRALGRDRLDTLLVERARSAGVQVLQPARARKISGGPGRFDCEYDLLSDRSCTATRPGASGTLRVPVVVDAHGSWQRGPEFEVTGAETLRRAPRLCSDLFAFKATFRNARLQSALLPVFAFSGGYGGMVVADEGRTTIACCIRRDALERCRRLARGESAATAVEARLRHSFRDIAEALDNAELVGPWLAVGPVRPGTRVDRSGVLRVGNAVGEAHPLVGEGIGMALQSAALLVDYLTRRPATAFDASRSEAVQQAYGTAWEREFAPRRRLAGAYAYIAMNPALTAATGVLFRRLPRLLTLSARLVGKARHVNRLRSTALEMT
jgi:flavin-dependent dehydrogenase